MKRRFRGRHACQRQIRCLRPGLVLLQHPDDLIFHEPCSLSSVRPSRRLDSKSPWRKICGRSPEFLEDYVAEDNPVRAIDVFVDELDLRGLGFEGVVAETTGRPAYHPARC